MTDPTTDAAREAVELSGAERVRKTVWTTLRGYLRDSFGGTDFVYVDERLDAYAAAVSRARDAEWRAAVEALKVNHRDGCEKCRPDGECINEGRAVFGNAALTALLARMEGKS